ncbi:MAG: hypothetical protein AAGH76_17640 [Pseudomonadota bacterium]
MKTLFESWRAAVVAVLMVAPLAGVADETGAAKLKKILDESLHPMLDRELPTLTFKTVTLGDNLIQLDVPKEMDPVIQDVRTGIWSIYMKHPDEAFELSCLVFFQTNFVANGIANLMQRSRDALVELEQVPDGTEGTSGYLHSQFYGDNFDIVLDAESIAVFDRDTKNVAIYSRGAGGLLDDSTLVCVSSQFGYRETFTRIMQRMVASGVRPDLTTTPYFASVERVFLDDRPAGFNLLWLESISPDETFFWTSSSTLSVGSSLAIITDSTTTGTSTPTGTLVSGSTRTISMSGIQADIELSGDTGEPGVWTAKGQMNGEEVDQQVLTDQALLSPLGIQQAYLRSSTAPVGSSTSLTTWDPNKPDAITTNTVRRTAQGLALDYAPMVTVELDVDTDGSLKRSSYRVPAGDTTIRVRSERHHVAGHIPVTNDDLSSIIDD